jgi:hypothetical protein
LALTASFTSGVPTLIFAKDRFFGVTTEFNRITFRESSLKVKFCYRTTKLTPNKDTRSEKRERVLIEEKENDGDKG